jgi:arsenate reductase-like glutaredoxin family protein
MSLQYKYLKKELSVADLKALYDYCTTEIKNNFNRHEVYNNRFRKMINYRDKQIEIEDLLNEILFVE